MLSAQTFVGDRLTEGEKSMTKILEIRERMKEIYSRYETFFIPIVKFALALLVFGRLNGALGYMAKLDSTSIVLILSLMCSFLPVGCMVLFAAVISLLHMYALGWEVALVGLCLYVVMFLMFFRLSTKEAALVLITPLLCAMKIPYIVPIAAGLLCAPTAFIPVACGLAVYYWFQVIQNSVSTLGTLGDDSLSKLRLVIDGLVQNKSMIVVVAAFSITILVVYLIRRLSVDYAWTIAMVVGAIVNVFVLLIGDLKFDINISIWGALGGSLLALAVAKVIEFFRFCVDYSRTEQVQFEDDEYYYYVKAVPKMTVATPEKTVKKINSQNVRTRDRSPLEVFAGKSGNGSKSGRKGSRTLTIGSAREPYDDYYDSYEETPYEDEAYEEEYAAGREDTYADETYGDEGYDEAYDELYDENEYDENGDE